MLSLDCSGGSDGVGVGEGVVVVVVSERDKGWRY